MSCSCGESKCSCSEECFCLSELCLCKVCFHLKETAAVKSKERNIPLESSLNASRVPIKVETIDAGNNSDEGNAEIVYSSYENLKSDLVSNVLFPEITISDSENETVLRQQDSSKVAECSLKKEDGLLKIKSDNKAVDLKLSNYRRYFEYFSSKVTNSKRKSCRRSWNNYRVQKNGFKVLSRKSKLSQSRKRLASFRQHEIEWENESNNREINVEGDNERSKFNTYFHDGSLSYSDYDTDDSKNTKTSTTSNHLSLLSIGGSFSEPEITGCDLSETEPCSRCKRKKRRLSYYKSLQNNEMLMESSRISKFEKGSSISFRQQTDSMPSNNETEIGIKEPVTKSSTLLRNQSIDIGDLSVYDFDEKESEISSSSESLNFRNRSVKIDNSGKLQINIYSTVREPSYSGKSSQNVDSGEMDSPSTSKNQYVSPLNASSSAGTLNDSVIIHESSRSIHRKIAPKILRRIRRKRKKTTKCKREENYVERKIKKETKIKTEIKKEKMFSGTSFIKREIKKEIP